MKKRISRFGLIAFFAAVFSASSDFANNYYAKVTVSASPSGAGTVYVSKTSTKGTSTSVTSDATTTSGGSRTFCFWAEANAGYTFSNWSSTAGVKVGNGVGAIQVKVQSK